MKDLAPFAGGTQAQSLYTPNNEDYDDRLTQPQIRIGGDLVPVDWEAAIEAWARATEIATENGDDPNGYGQKMYFYNFIENTFAGTKLCFDVVGSPNWGGHNRPALTPECPGMVNAGLSEWSYAYEDAAEADTMVIAGADPKENQDVIFSKWIHEEGDPDIVASTVLTAATTPDPDSRYAVGPQAQVLRATGVLPDGVLYLVSRGLLCVGGLLGDADR